MWPSESNTSKEDAERKSDISCRSCRRRKIKCGRELPHCLVCEQTEQECEYPLGPLKPGPKIGTLHRSRKRRRENKDDGAQGSQQSCESPGAQVKAVEVTRRRMSHSDTADGRQRSSSSFEDSGGVVTPSGEEEDQNTQHRTSLNIGDLSFILHPSHEASTPEKEHSTIYARDAMESEEPVVIARACYVLGVTPDVLQVKIYFDNMVAIRLFNEPSFWKKVQNITSSNQRHALLAAMLSYATRFRLSDSENNQQYPLNGLSTLQQRPYHFLNMALKLIDDSLRECDDEPPSICILQAQIISAHIQLTQGVRGKAWRSLGTCVRLAYELNLHLVDSAAPKAVTEMDPKQWSEEEEKRRAWWAIWEMDVFASTVRRCPTAIDWSQIETLLPVEDEYWFEETPRPSCFLERDLIRRWKVLQECGNQSYKAWFIVVNSLMKEAQCISSPRGIPNLSLPDERRRNPKSSKLHKSGRTVAEESREKLETLSNSVRCLVLALPPFLKYRNQYLGFDAREPGQTTSLRQLHSGIYNIYVMTQLARLMINHYDVFSGATRAEHQEKHARYDRTSSSSSSRGASTDVESVALSQYFEAADNILGIINRCCDDHIQYINPFLPSTIWLASAVQLTRKEFGPPGTNRTLVKSKFEVLYMTYKKCVGFWDIKTAMQQNLESLEAQLEGFRTSGWKIADRPEPKSQGGASAPPACGDPQGYGPSKDSAISEDGRSHADLMDGLSSLPHHRQSICSNDLLPNNIDSRPRRLVQNPSPISSTQKIPRQAQPQQLLVTGQDQCNLAPTYMEPISPAMSTLDFMHLPSQIPEQPGGVADAPSDRATLMDTFFAHNDKDNPLSNDPTQGLAFGLHMDGGSMELPSYIDELLSGSCMY